MVLTKVQLEVLLHAGAVRVGDGHGAEVGGRDAAGQEQDQQHGQEKPQGRDLRRALACQEVPRQPRRLEDEAGQRAKHPAVGVEEILKRLAGQMPGRMMEILAELAALKTPGALQERRAVPAGRPLRQCVLAPPAQETPRAAAARFRVHVGSPKRVLFEKRTKNFLRLGTEHEDRPGLNLQKFFASFFKKEVLPSFLPRPQQTPQQSGPIRLRHSLHVIVELDGQRAGSGRRLLRAVDELGEFAGGERVCAGVRRRGA